MPKQVKVLQKVDDTILAKCMKFVWLGFFHRFRSWNCMISIFGLWMSTLASYNSGCQIFSKWPPLELFCDSYFLLTCSEIFVKASLAQIYKNFSGKAREAKFLEIVKTWISPRKIAHGGNHFGLATELKNFQMAAFHVDVSGTGST